MDNHGKHRPLPIIYLAPLQGMTDRIYRNLFPLYFKGVDLAVAPFISTVGKIKNESKLLRDIDPTGYTGLSTIPQIMSTSPKDFVRLANRLYELGYSTVNWNLGCPFRRVIQKGRGAGMLCYPDRIEAFLEKGIPDLKPSLSIKLRLGVQQADDIFELLPIFNRYELAELIIHPRTASQMYTGTVDEDAFEKCLMQSQHRLVYNGDIDSKETAEKLALRFPSVTHWMIGRGLLANPFLAEEMKSETKKPANEKVRILRNFHDHVFAEQAKILCGPGHLINKMKEFWTYTADFFEDADKIRKRIHKTHHADQYRKVIDQIFDESLAGEENPHRVL